MLAWFQSAAFLFFERVFICFFGSLPACAVIAGALGAGLAILPASLVPGLTRKEYLLLAFGCGSGLLSCAILLIGSIGALSMPVAWALAGVAVAIGTWNARALQLTLDLRPRGASRVLFLLGAATLAALLVASFAPPLLYDVTEYHVGALKHYLDARCITPMPYNFFARFPFAVESLYYMGLVLESARGLAPKLINAAFVLATALLIMEWLRRARCSLNLQLLGAIVFLTHTVTLEISIDAYIDGAVTFFVVASFYAAFLAASASVPSLVYGAVLLFGTALASKYTVAQIYLLPWLICAGGPLMIRVIRERRWKLLAGALGLAAVPLLFWLGKNVIFYGNPLEPFFCRIFRPNDLMARLREQFYTESHHPQSPLSAEYWSSLSTRVSTFSWYVLVPLIAVPCITRVTSTSISSWRVNARLLIAIAVSYLLWNLIRQSESRFLLAAIVMLVIVGMQAIAALPRQPKLILCTLLVAFSSAHLFVHMVRLANGNEFQYFAAFPLSKPARPSASVPAQSLDSVPDSADTALSDFLRKNLGSFGDAIVETNRLPNVQQLLLIYEARPYLFDADTVYNTVFDDSVLLTFAKGAKSGIELAAQLRKAGITHVLVNRQELRRFIDQYARKWQLEKLGITDPVAEFDRIPVPEDLYPPFYLSLEWDQSRAVILDFLRVMRTRAIIVTGRPPLEVYVAPL